MFGYKVTDDLDEIFNLDNLDAPVYEHERRPIFNHQNPTIISTDSALETGSQVSKEIENDQQNRFRNTEIFQTSSTSNVRDSWGISTGSILGRRSSSSTQLTDLTYFSLNNRSSMGEFLQRPRIMTQENSVSVPTQDEQPQTQMFNDSFNSTTLSTSSRLYSENNFFGQANSTQQTAIFFGNSFSAISTSYHEFQDQRNTQRSVQDSQSFSDFNSLTSHTNFGSRVPTSIMNLYENVKSNGFSDWTFVHLLSAQLCQEFMPMNCNVTLKKSLLLSIASINTKTDQIPIPIIAIGENSSSANSIMLSIGNFAQRFLAPTDHLFNVSINSDNFVEVGPIFLAKNGVCYLGDWSGLKKTFSEEVKIIIDSGRYFLNQTSKNFQLGSAIWTYSSSTQKLRNYNVNVPIFLKYFGIPIVLDADDESTIDFLIDEAKGGSNSESPKNVFSISYDDLKAFLNTTRKVKVKKSDDAQRLLAFYSETIKKDREDALSVRGFQVIHQMADSFAKLCMRDVVEVGDVEAAIAIAEETFSKILNPQITRFPQAPILGCTFDVQKIDQYLQNFHTWIYHYIAFGNNQAERILPNNPTE